MYTAINFTSMLPSFNNDSDFRVESLTADNKMTLLRNTTQNFRGTGGFPLVQVEMRNHSGEITTRVGWFIGYNDNNVNTFSQHDHRLSAYFLVQIDDTFIIAASQTLRLNEFQWAHFESDTSIISMDLLGRTLDDTYVIIPAEEINMDVREALTLVNKI